MPELDVGRDFGLILGLRGGTEKVEKDLRASLVAAIAAAALSGLVGIIAGVGFFILLLRAIVGGLVLGVAVYAGILVLRKAVPGIFESDEALSADAVYDSAASPEMGANVDIVLPGEAPDSEAIVAGAEPINAKPFYDSAEDPSFVEEVRLLEPEGEESSVEAAIPSSAGAERERRPSLGIEDLDVLPDLDSFSGSFDATEFGVGGSAVDRSDRSPAGNSSVRMSGSKAGQDGVDPAALAQAVRTILKRDQKG
jgi:hypothetical protein